MVRITKFSIFVKREKKARRLPNVRSCGLYRSPEDNRAAGANSSRFTTHPFVLLDWLHSFILFQRKVSIFFLQSSFMSEHSDIFTFLLMGLIQ